MVVFGADGIYSSPVVTLLTDDGFRPGSMVTMTSIMTTMERWQFRRYKSESL